MSRRAVVLVVLGVLAFGCSKGPRAGTSAPGPKGTSEADRVKEGIVNATVPPKGAYDVGKPGSGGWSASMADMVSVGERMDQALVPSKSEMCRAQLYYDDPTVGNLRFNPQFIKIQDAEHFDVEYAIPETKASKNRFRANGARRVSLREDVWKELPPFDAPHRRLTDEEVKAFPKRFPETMFSGLKDGSDVWGSLFAAWANGVGGYKATFEEQTFTEAGKKRTQYRVIATTNDGGPTEVEVIIDRDKLRPLTVRSKGTASNGKEYRIMWTGTWLTGGKFDDKDFTIPKVLPKPGASA